MEFAKFEGLLAFYTSKSIPIIGKLIGTLYIIRFECQQSSHSAHIGHSVHVNYPNYPNTTRISIKFAHPIIL